MGRLEARKYLTLDWEMPLDYQDPEIISYFLTCSTVSKSVFMEDVKLTQDYCILTIIGLTTRRRQEEVR